jgi:threonine dehydrogenase-like Zn-dependent dehydrogenase
VVGYGGLTPDNITSLVEGTIFTRAPKEKKNTAIFVGGSDMVAGQELFAAVQKHFFPGFQVSIMLDSNGSNTTAAAGVAKLATSGTIAGKKAVILAGTGPVGQRAAVMLAQEGAEVSLTSRTMERAVQACNAMKARFGVDLIPVEATDNEARAKAIEYANIVFATGKAGVELLTVDQWQNNSHIEMMADANATPPIGIGGTDMMDKGIERHGKIIWGAIGFGTLKLALHRACIAKLFEDNRQVFDAENIFALAMEMA